MSEKLYSRENHYVYTANMFASMRDFYWTAWKLGAFAFYHSKFLMEKKKADLWEAAKEKQGFFSKLSEPLNRIWGDKI